MNESELLSKKRCEEVLLAAQTAAFREGVEDVEIHFTATDDALTRFANNGIHQNVAERSVTASIRVATGAKTARAATNRLSRDGIQAAVEEAVTLARASHPLDELPPMYETAARIESDRYSEECARCTPAERARLVAEAIRAVEQQGQTAAGIYSTAENVEALYNSRGVAHYYVETLTTFSITAMAEDSSGWAKASSTVHEDVQPVELARRAARKAQLSANPRSVDPGAWTVILEPAAVLDFAGQMFADFSATAIDDQRSFLVDRAGLKVFGGNITIFDDVQFPLQAGAPFDGEGVPRRALTLVKRGCIGEIPHSRMAAARAGVEATGHGFPLPNDTGEMPVNIVIAGGNATLDDLVASTDKGILVTRCWYVRETDQYDKAMTGMTRDGTFLIRDGEIAHGIHNLRFNDSILRALSNAEALSNAVRASGEEAFDMVVPAMKIRDFVFTEVTKY